MMDNGEIVEDGSPAELMGDSESLLYKLVEEFGPEFPSMSVLTRDQGKSRLKNSLMQGRDPELIIESKGFLEEKINEDSDST